MERELIYNTLNQVYDFDMGVITDEDLNDFEQSEAFKPGDMDSPTLYCHDFVRYYMHKDLYAQPMHEDGMAMVTAGNTSGMGAVVTPSVGSIPGVPNGTTGSGDVGAGTIPNMRSRDSHLPRSRRKAKAKQAVKSMKKAMGNNPFLNPVQKAPSVQKKASSILSFSAFKESAQTPEQPENE